MNSPIGFNIEKSFPQMDVHTNHLLLPWDNYNTYDYNADLYGLRKGFVYFICNVLAF